MAGGHDRDGTLPTTPQLRRVITWVMIPLVVATLVAAGLLWPERPDPPEAAGATSYDGTVTEVRDQLCPPEQQAAGFRRCGEVTVATPRLQVRQLMAGDTAAVAEVFDDKQTRRWLPFPTESGEVDAAAWCTDLAAQRRSRGIGDHYGMVRREDEALVGCLWTKHTDWAARITEVAYAVAPATRGFGLAAEAVDGLAIALLLEHGFQRVELRVAPGNLASRRVAEKAGFTYEGLLRNAGHVHSGRVDLEVWSLVTADLR